MTDLLELADRVEALAGVRCSECPSRDAVLVTGQDIYPHRPDLFHKSFYRCPCGAYVGCHPGTRSALGSCAGPATRAARSRAHAFFDPIWRRKIMKRSQAYAALAEQMGIPVQRCHISWMGLDEANRAVEAAAALRARAAEKSDSPKSTVAKLDSIGLSDSEKDTTDGK